MLSLVVHTRKYVHRYDEPTLGILVFGYLKLLFEPFHLLVCYIEQTFILFMEVDCVQREKGNLFNTEIMSIVSTLHESFLGGIEPEIAGQSVCWIEYFKKFL